MAVHMVFPGVEYRECMRHLWKNMKKHYKGSLFFQDMWAAAKTFTSTKYNYHMGKKSPDALEWVHLSENFNSWMLKTEDLHIVQMLDKNNSHRLILVTN
jgi:hypothetical protein